MVPLKLSSKIFHINGFNQGRFDYWVTREGRGGRLIRTIVEVLFSLIRQDVKPDSLQDQFSGVRGRFSVCFYGDSCS